MKKATELQAYIDAAARLLRSTERGQAVANWLWDMCNGPLAGLDGRGYDALFTLLIGFRFGFAGTVLEAIDPDSPK